MILDYIRMCKIRQIDCRQLMNTVYPAAMHSLFTCSSSQHFGQEVRSDGPVQQTSLTSEGMFDVRSFASQGE